MLKTEGLVKEYDGVKIDLVDQVFEKGKSYCILGPSGSGKTTLLGMLSGEIETTEGRVLYEGKELTKADRQLIGYITQTPQLLENMTVADNLNIIREVHQIDRENSTVLERVGMKHKEKQKAKSLSGGERSRLAIAREMLKDVEILLCDEPTGSLNYDKGREIMEYLQEMHKAQGGILIVVTHDDRMVDLFDEVLQYSKMLRGVSVC